jgi:hypothetical protein
MEFLGIALIIITTIISVHVVYEKGKQAGEVLGRQQILVENLKKSEIQQSKFDRELKNTMTKLGM